MTVQSDDADLKPSRTRRLGGRRIYEALKAQIGEGLYQPGAAVPSTRALATELGVARSTVTSAYEQLLAEGFLESRQGAPTRVAPLLPVPAEGAGSVYPRSRHRLSAYGERMKMLADSAAPASVGREPVIDFRYGDLSTADFPTLLWKRALSAAASHRPDRLTYGRPEGSLRLRTALQGYLWRARGIRCEAEQIIIVSGSQQGLDLCARILLDPADRFVVENPCYQMARQAFAATGAVPVSVSAREDGLDTGLLAHTHARLAYVTPSHQFPLGGVMPVARRQQLLAWASATGAYVVEDDYDGEFRLHRGHTAAQIAFRIADMTSANSCCHFGPTTDRQLLRTASHFAADPFEDIRVFSASVIGSINGRTFTAASLENEAGRGRAVQNLRRHTTKAFVLASPVA